MPLPILGGTKVADTAFSVANSCRFNKADDPELSRSTGDGNEDIGSFSFWWKPAKTDSGCIFYSVYVDSNNFFDISCDGSMNLQVRNKLSGSYNMDIKTNRVFRDPLAWYSIIVLIDTTQSTEANRVKIYINGTQETSLATSSYPSQNTDMIMNSNSRTARISSSQDRMHGYLAEFVLIDGTAKAVTDFGEFDEDSPTIWKPKDVEGLSGDKGVNGFYLDFETSGTLGNCAFGGTDFTSSNLAAGDQCQDSPTNNFCVVNPLDNFFNAASFTQGNTVTYTDGGAKYTFNTGTFFLTQGKWYFEVKVVAGNNSGNSYVIGISDDTSGAVSEELGNEDTQWGYYGLGHIRHDNGNTASSDYNTYTDGDIIGVYMDLDNNKLYFAKNGTIENSTGISITAPSSLASGGYFPSAGYFDGDASSNSAYFYWNFGNGDYNATAVSSSNADDDGFGLFEYDPTSGTFDGASKKFYSICTKNLAKYG